MEQKRRYGFENVQNLSIYKQNNTSRFLNSINHIQQNKSSNILIVVYVEGGLTNDLDLVTKQWLTEYKSLFNPLNYRCVTTEL